MNVYKIEFKSKEHAFLREAIRSRWYFSRERFSARHKQWAEAEDRAMLYMPQSENDRKRANLRTEGSTQFTTIDIPYSYAQMLSMHTYWTSVYLGRNPVHQFSGRHAGTEGSTQALEAIIDYQVNTGGALLPYYVWLLDVAKYGIGILGTYWDHEQNMITEIVDKPVQFLGIDTGKTKKVKQSRLVSGYKGNRSFNVRPYDFFPDPRVPISQFQKGEFCGRYVETSWNTIAKKGAQGYYFNLDEAKATKPSNWRKQAGSPRLTLPNTNSGEIDPSMYARDPLRSLDYYELMEMHVELIPKEWHLGTSEYPEKWCFTLCNDSVIIGAWPLGLNHNQYPFDIGEYELEGYGLFKRGVLELLDPLNKTLTWLFNSHFHNVRKVINNQLVADPSRVVLRDITDPQGGRLIRLTPQAYGTDPKASIHQLPVADVTANHISSDAKVVMEMMNRIAGMNDGLMGSLASGGRKSATEVRSANAYGVNRQKTITEIFSAEAFGPHAMKLVQNTQQFYDIEQSYKIAGPLMQNAQAYLTVTPDSIAGFYDFVPVDGTLPIDRQAQAMLWVELMKQMINYPQIMMEYDISSIFGWVSQLAGIKNLQQFKIQVKPDAMIQQQLGAGNTVPLRSPNAGSNGGIPGSGTGGPVQPPGPPRMAAAA